MENITEIVKGLTAIDDKITALENDRQASQKALSDEIKRVGDEQVKLAKALADAEQGKTAGVKTADAPLSFGESFVKSANYGNFASNRKTTFEFKKAATPSTTSAANSISRDNVALPYQVAGMLTLPERPLVIEDLFPHVPVSTNSVEYMKEGSYTSAAAIVAEGADKPETKFTAPTLHTANIVTIAHWTKITNQLAADAPALAAYINTKMQYALQATVDAQLVTGTGGATQLPGILKEGNYTDPVTAGSITKADFGSDATLFDFVLKVKSVLENTYITPEFILLNPADWTKLAMLKDGQKRYILGGPQAIASKSLWGIPVITSASVTQGKYILGNLQVGATIYDRQALNLAMSDSDDQNFTQNLITIRVERRLGVAYEFPQAVMGGDFALPTA